ncbi:hypothetical protein OR1_02349 [Geobacter sp. OR-1]|nr:hypothetical protein OR1_02349 [Geobacter sp. OR-1]
MQMQLGAVLWVVGTPGVKVSQRGIRVAGVLHRITVRTVCILWPHTGSHYSGINREKERLYGFKRQFVDKLDPHRPVFLGHDDWTEIMDRRRGNVIGIASLVCAVVYLNISLERGIVRQVRMHFFGISPQFDLVIIGP